jgi:hypothetical protein
LRLELAVLNTRRNIRCSSAGIPRIHEV